MDHREAPCKAFQPFADFVAGSCARLAVILQSSVQLICGHAILQHRAMPVLGVDQAQRLTPLLHLAQQDTMSERLSHPVHHELMPDTAALPFRTRASA